MAHIVILGAGLGGLSMAYAMRKAARHDDRVTSGHGRAGRTGPCHFVPIEVIRVPTGVSKMGFLIEPTVSMTAGIGWERRS